MRGQRIPPCFRCRQNTPPLGETICRKCAAAEESRNEREDMVARFYANIDCVDDVHTKHCLEALFDLIQKEHDR